MIQSIRTGRTATPSKKLLSHQPRGNISLYLPSNTFISNDLSLYSISTTVTTIFVPRESPPSYASAACSNNGDLYASACSCWGITADTITASTPTTIVTVTATYVTTTPSSPYNCINPGKCGSLKYINDSLCGSKGRCTCSYDLRGNPVCVEEVDCASKNTCNTDADCVGGEICWDKDNTCCRDNLCTKLSTVCANTASTRLMFQGGKEVRLPRVRIGEN